MLRPSGRLVALAIAIGAVGAAPGDASSAAGPVEPLDVAREFYKALHAGKARTAAKLTAGADDEPVLRSFVQISSAYRSLEEALAKRFGPDAAAAVGYGRKVQSEVKALLGATVEIEGDTARVAALDGQTISTLRQVGGAWRVELDEALETPEGRAALATHARATDAAARHVVPRIRSGKYQTPDAALEDFEARVARGTGGVRQGAPPQRGAPEPEGTQL